MDLCDKYPTNMFYIPFEDIFNMFHLYKLGGSLVHLWAINRTYITKMEGNRNVAVANPYLMHEFNLNVPDRRQAMKTYLAEFMISNMEKECLLVPYYPSKSFSSYITIMLENEKFT